MLLLAWFCRIAKSLHVLCLALPKVSCLVEIVCYLTYYRTCRLRRVFRVPNQYGISLTSQSIFRLHESTHVVAGSGPNPFRHVTHDDASASQPCSQEGHPPFSNYSRENWPVRSAEAYIYTFSEWMNWDHSHNFVWHNVLHRERFT